MTRGRGSSSGSSVLAEAVRLRTAPAAIILAQRDGVIVTGAMVARQLYGLDCPIMLLPDLDGIWDLLAAQPLITLPEILPRSGVEK